MKLPGVRRVTVAGLVLACLGIAFGLLGLLAALAAWGTGSVGYAWAAELGLGFGAQFVLLGAFLTLFSVVLSSAVCLRARFCPAT